MLNLRSACTKVPMIQNTCKISYPEIVMDARGNKYLHVKFQIYIYKKKQKKVIKLLELTLT